MLQTPNDFQTMTKQLQKQSYYKHSNETSYLICLDLNRTLPILLLTKTIMSFENLWANFPTSLKDAAMRNNYTSIS